MISEVYDIECLSNLFTYTGLDRQTGEFHQFVIHSSRNDYKKFYDHLHRGKLIMIGFNNENYDYPIIHHMIRHYDRYIYLSGRDIAERIYEKSQQIIEQEFSMISDRNKLITQIDLFRIHHYNNVARATSLKALEVAMNIENVEDMPFDHSHYVKNDQIQEILEYNKNDVIATSKFLDITLGNTEHTSYKGRNMILLRQIIGKKYGLRCLNWDDIKIGTELILKLYSYKFNVDPYTIKRMSTPRPIINLGDCIPKWVNFKSDVFKELVNKFSKLSIFNGVTKGVINESVIYNNIKIDYGTGGAHACIASGVYKSSDKKMILDLDIDSMYPMLAISQNIYPEHLGPEFIDIYDGEIVSVRLAEKKKPKNSRDFVIMEGFKLAANGTYGKSNEEKSWLYDPLYTMKTTISGQLLISMWAERLVNASKGLKILQINTDGITVIINRDDFDNCIKASDQLMKETGMSYEYAEYNQMIIRDVNNYISEYTDGSCKYKGAFEIDKLLHKDPSMRIVPIAISNYFIKGIPVMKTLKNHDNIYDFCLRLRVNRGWNAKMNTLTKHGEIKEHKLPRTNRYYVSKTGGALFKENIANGNTTGVNVGSVVTIFNKFIEKPINEYNIDYQFYLKECNKIINIIESTPRSLFDDI